MENRNAKSLLARLMAAENLNVEYSESATTAAFDTEGRTLIMPLLKDVSDEATDLFLGHEVGHALYTPQGRIKDIVAEGGQFKSFVNITEDARIEKMIQIKFPGLRRCFYDGYTELLAKNFFGTVDNDVNSYNLIDRLNLHFKGGIRAGVDFSADEETYVTRMENLSTFDDAVELARDLYVHHKEEAENNKSEESDPDVTTDSGDGDTDDSGEMSSDMPMEFDEPEKSDEEGESSSGEKSGETDDTEEKAESSTSDEGEESESPGSDTKTKSSPGEGTDNSSANNEAAPSEENFGPVTQDAFDEAVKESIDPDTTVAYARIPTLPLEDIIIPIEEIHGVIDKNIGDEKVGITHALKQYKIFSTEQKSLISYLVKEFEMKKSADEHKRTSTGKTGILNPNKLHAYKFSEDIFLRSTVVADGKSHGFIMYIDWSGSMSDCMSKTIDQLMLLAMFCKKANIPFDCFAFSNYYFTADEANKGRYGSDPYLPAGEKEFSVRQNFKLLHLLSSQLNSQKFTKAMVYMTYLREAFLSRSYYATETSPCSLPNELQLGGTPLNEAVLTAFPMVPLFRKKYNVQIVNTVFLTDGAGASLREIHRTPTEENPARFERCDSTGQKLHITDMVTKKSYHVNKYNETDTGLLLKILKDRTDCRITGFFINTENKRGLHMNLRCIKPGMTYEEMVAIDDDMKKDLFARLETDGYEEFYVINGKKMDVKVDDLQITDDMSKAKMKSAFIKNRKAKLVSKKMLSQFAEFVS